MGLSNAISGGIVMFAIFYVIMTFPSILEEFFSVTQASSVNDKIENSILKTNIGITSLNATASSTLVDFTLNNLGNEKLWNFDKFTIIVSYDSGIISKSKYVEQFTYQNTCTGNVDTWCITKFNKDLQDPGILNPSESINIQCTLQNVVYPQGTVTVSTSTDNGVIASKSITAS